MNNEVIKNNDPIQLKQMIIFLKAELTKFEQIVKEYESMNDIATIENLEEENRTLVKERNELAARLKEMKKTNYLSTIETMKETKKEWLPLNKQLYDIETIINTQTETSQNNLMALEEKVTSLYEQFSGFHEKINEVMDLIQKSAEQIQSEIEEINAAQKNEDKANALLMEIEEKNQGIDKLQQKIEILKKQQEVERAKYLKEKQAISPDVIKVIEQQIEEVVKKSLQYEQDLNEKLAIMNILENKIEQLFTEMNHIIVKDEDKK